MTHAEEDAVILKEALVRFIALAGLYSTETCLLVEKWLNTTQKGAEPEEQRLIRSARCRHS